MEILKINKIYKNYYLKLGTVFINYFYLNSTNPYQMSL